MKITHFSKYNQLFEGTLEQVLEAFDLSQEEYARFESKELSKGTKILIVPYDGDIVKEPETLIELEKTTYARCAGFGTGLSSDHYLILDEGKDKLTVICSEPMELSQDKPIKNLPKYIGPKYEADHILLHV